MRLCLTKEMVRLCLTEEMVRLRLTEEIVRFRHGVRQQILWWPSLCRTRPLSLNRCRDFAFRLSKDRVYNARLAAC